VRKSIIRQATARLLASMGLFVLLLGFTSYRIYTLALEKSAHERAEDLATFYRTRLMQLDREWELQARDFKVRLEVTRMLEAPQARTIDLDAFMTVQGTNRRFAYMLIQKPDGERLFSFGPALDVKAIPLRPGQETGWYRSRDSGALYRVFAVPIWLGEGTGRMAVFYQVDNALLFNLTTPGILLLAEYAGEPLASSSGQSGLDKAVQRSPEAEVRDIPWSADAGEEARLHIVAPFRALFTRTELVFSAAAIPIVDGLILWFTLGFWLMRNAVRIRALGAAVHEFAARRRPGPELQENIDFACNTQGDEISEVAAAIIDMAERSLKHEEERTAEAAQQRLWAMVHAASNEAIVITDAENRILTVNRAFTRLTGYAADEVIGQNPRMLSSGRETREFYAAMWQELKQRDCWSGEVEDRRKDGSLYPKWLSISVVRGADGRPVNYIGLFADITERKQNEERLVYLANHDSLTGLPNRHLLLDRLRSAIAMSQRSDETIGLLFLDIDNFKWINDSLGHAAGDQLLTSVAERLTGMVRASDTVARLGGDEFVVLLTQTGSDLEIAQVAEKVIAAVARPLDLSGHEFHVTTSMGISTFPNDGQDAESLLKHADTAMYAAKSAGKNQFSYFDPAMNRAALERVELEQELRQALKRNEFELFYQPKYCVERQSVCGAEALIRWRHPRLGLVPPIKFIPLAEETSLIIEIGEWAIRSACNQIVEWQRAGLNPRRIAVNLSAIQLESDSFVPAVQRILQETGAPVSSLEFELTESMVLRNPDRSVVTLDRLRQFGIRLALDDFGTGYSSLSYLKRLPVHSLKVDRSFIEGVPRNPDDSQIVRMIIALARSVQLEVVAEGIETPAQRDFLTQLGCDFLQGYLFGKPMPAPELTALLTPACDQCRLLTECATTTWHRPAEVEE
jgi:diguanylate cyclase (GGDEF)-like protein/PAS domain S-box-containing protein